MFRWVRDRGWILRRWKIMWLRVKDVSVPRGRCQERDCMMISLKIVLQERLLYGFFFFLSCVDCFFFFSLKSLSKLYIQTAGESSYMKEHGKYKCVEIFKKRRQLSRDQAKKTACLWAFFEKRSRKEFPFHETQADGWCLQWIPVKRNENFGRSLLSNYSDVEGSFISLAVVVVYDKRWYEVFIKV